MAVAIVTDSTSEIDPERGAALGMTVVPLFVIFGDRSYRDYLDLSRADFFDKLKNEPALPTTSQPTAQMFEDAFRPLVEAGHDILCVSISSLLSGTINAARAGAQRFPDARIELFDSLTASAGLGIIAERAAELAREGASIDDILASLTRERATQRLYACLADLSHLVRTGRIGKARAVIGGLMKIVPVLCLKDGAVAAEAQVRTFSRAQETMLDLTMKMVTDVPTADFRVIHTNAPALAEAATAKLLERLNGVAPRSMVTVEAGPAIATHAGPGAVGVFIAQNG